METTRVVIAVSVGKETVFSVVSKPFNADAPPQSLAEILPTIDEHEGLDFAFRFKTGHS